jgi:hydroxylamine reductase (hybrid-cluster protein)
MEDADVERERLTGNLHDHAYDHVGCTSDAEALVRQGIRTSLSDGWGGSMMGTDFSDILFGTPMPKDTEADLGVLEKEMVNIIIHGHEPALSEMVVAATEDPELIQYAKSKGAKGINIAGLCCTANEVAMRHGVKIAGNYLQQEQAVLTGAVEAMVVDIQCIFRPWRLCQNAITQNLSQHRRKLVFRVPSIWNLMQRKRMILRRKLLKQRLIIMRTETTQRFIFRH